MKCIQATINADKGYLIPLADFHIGDKGFDKKKLQGYLEWIEEEPNARVWLNGDILNVATTTSASSVFDQDEDLKQQVQSAIELLTPIKDKIVGAISGNHEQRLEKFCGYNPLIPVCSALGVPYLGYSAILAIKIQTNKGKRPKKENGESQIYTFYCHHTTGGGGSVGNKMNRIAKLKEIVGNTDGYIGSHNHQLGVIPVEARHYNVRGNRIDTQRQLLIDTGGFLKWNDGYAEMKQLTPTKLGAVRIRMDGIKKDLHCDL